MFDKLLSSMKDSSKQKYVFMAIGVAILGIILTYVPFGNKQMPAAATVVTQNDTSKGVGYEADLEKRLTDILKEIDGVGDVEVMITAYSNEEKVLAEDVTQSSQQSKEEDQSGGTRDSQSSNVSNQVVLQNGNVPYVIKENKPQVKGVLIVADGADNATVKSEIIDAVSRLLDVPVHKISVMKKQK